MRLASQLINSISRVLQKLLKYFNDTVILIYFLFPSTRCLSVILILYLNNSDRVIVSFGSSL